MIKLLNTHNYINYIIYIYSYYYRYIFPNQITYTNIVGIQILIINVFYITTYYFIAIHT